MQEENSVVRDIPVQWGPKTGKEIDDEDSVVRPEEGSRLPLLSTSKVKSVLAYYPKKLRSSFKKIGKSQSMKMVLDEEHDPKDEQIVESFRELLFVEGHLIGKQKHADFHTLLRFLKMRNRDLPKAKESYLNYLKWRKDFGVDAILKDFKFDEYLEVKKCYPHGYHGVDRYGRPVYIERIGMVDLETLLQLTNLERLVKHHVLEQERTQNLRFPACSIAAKKRIASVTSILDVKGVGMSNFSKPARYLFMEIQKIDSCYYPETLHRLFIINAGSGFKMLWKAIKAFLDARTLAKVQVLGNNYQSELREVIDASNLPSFLGGNCTCPDSGGCLLSDRGPWHDPEILAMLEAISAGEDNGNEEALDAVSEDNLDLSDGDKLALQKVEALEDSLREAMNKIQALEAALNSMKMIIQELMQETESMRM